MARIRTIKPEFWSSPVMGRQDDSTKLLAIALLNYADDEGYFYAEPNLVRGFCRPFDDNSSTTKKSLEKLEKIEYISISKNETYGDIGFIEKFNMHQKIDRPTTSKLKEYYSTNTRRILDEASLLERKGKERKGKEHGIEFTPPSKEEVILFFKENGFNEKLAERMFNSYAVSNWVDSKGNKIKNWKQKCHMVWFKDENKNQSNLFDTPKQPLSQSELDALKRKADLDMLYKKVEL